MIYEYKIKAERDGDVIKLVEVPPSGGLISRSTFEQVSINISNLKERAILEMCSTEELERINKTINKILEQRKNQQ